MRVREGVGSELEVAEVEGVAELKGRRPLNQLPSKLPENGSSLSSAPSTRHPTPRSQL